MRTLPALLLLLSAFSFLDARNQDWNEFFPNGLTDKDGSKIDPNALDGRKVLLYFSASWCGPCHAFTPKLKKFYEEYRDHLEVVLVSKDKNKETFVKYKQKYDMPWLAVKFPEYSDAGSGSGQSPNEVERLVREYEAWGIPKLVVLDRRGEVEDEDARMMVAMLPEERAKMYQEYDPVKSAESWKNYKEKEGHAVSSDELEDKIEYYEDYYKERASDMESLYRKSQRRITLRTNPDWEDLVFHYYQAQRDASEEKGSSFKLRTWTNKSGESFEGTFVSKSPYTVTIKRSRDGVTFDVPISILSKADKKYLTEIE